MDITDIEKIKKSDETFLAFTESIDGDFDKDLVIDVLLELIYGETLSGNDLHLPSETRQEQHPTIGESRAGEMPTYEIE